MDRKTKHQYMVYEPYIRFFFYTCLWCSSRLFCSARDTLRYEDWIRENEAEEETLVSAKGMFELGFFTPNENSKGGRYVGIWYHKLSPRTVVWVANRDHPLDNSRTRRGAFGIEKDGYLQVVDQSFGTGKSYWSSDLKNSSSSLNRRIVTLLDSGNLVLTEYNNRLGKRSTLWQSFEHPTDTFLPGMKMVENLMLTSWRNEDDPGNGDFRFKVGVGKYQFVIMNKSAFYWKSGQPDKLFSPIIVPGLIYKFLSNLSEVPHCKNACSTDSPARNLTPPLSKDSYTRLVINYTGNVLYEKWDKVWSTGWSEPSDRCSVFNVCGEFGICNSDNKRLVCKCLPGLKPVHPDKWNSGDYSDGCTRGVKLCGGEDEKFLSLNLVKVGNQDSAVPVPVNNETECKKVCLDNCQCQAYSFKAVDQQSRQRGFTGPLTNSCWTWSETLKDLQEQNADDGGPNLFVRVALSDLKSRARICDPCGTTMIPYPLSTGPNCGDPMYFNFQCNNSSGIVNFKASSGEYRVISINPSNQTFVIKVQGLDNCKARNSRGENLLPKQPSPFNLTSWCSDEYSPIDGDEVEVNWKPPLEPTCNSQANCKEWPNSACSNATSDGNKRCICPANFKWDGVSLNCTLKPGGNLQPTKEEPSRTRILLNLIVLTTVIGAIVLSCIITSFVIWRRKLAKRRERKKLSDNRALRMLNTETHIQELMNSSEFKEDDGKGIDVPFFNLGSVIAATDNFSDENKLGQGGYGPVYKGKFPGGQEIAVKRLSSVSRQGLQEFKNEVVLIAKLQHRNLVRLRGYCMERDEKILLYEYMPNKSLDSLIFDDTKSEFLVWEMRFDIIMGIARGLLYLHQDSRLRIIHRDFKTSNILLDHGMNPKISDFGLARMVGGKQTEANTDRVVGTYGYMSPEYALEGVFSIKSDVFSFGVVLLEIISGKRNTRFVYSDPPLSLLGYAWKLWTENKVFDLMDQTLQESCKEDQFIKCVNVGLLCVQEDPSDRPNMSNVITMLDSDSILPSPKQPAFVHRRGSNTASSSSKPESHTEMSYTVEEGR